jgi:hypothetical protein
MRPLGGECLTANPARSYAAKDEARGALAICGRAPFLSLHERGRAQMLFVCDPTLSRYLLLRPDSGFVTWRVLVG